jgi:hypothetical protein
LKEKDFGEEQPDATSYRIVSILHQYKNVSETSFYILRGVADVTSYSIEEKI